MAGANLCVSCAQLPQKDKSLAVASKRCQECKTTFGVTSYGSAFRFASAQPRPFLSRGFVIGVAVGGGLLSFILLLVGLGMWSRDVVVSKAPPVDPKAPIELTRVPEVGVDDPISHNLDRASAKQKVVALIAKIRHENAQGVNKDAFVLAQMERRKELRGMPFVMGAECRLEPQRATSFEKSVEAVRDGMERDQSSGADTAAFWSTYQARSGGQGVQTPHGVAALVQILGPERVGLRQSLVEQLGHSNSLEASRALARSAIFDASSDVRRTALRELKKRPKDHNVDDILMHGIRHPMPLVAHRAAFAVGQLERKDLGPQLVAFLDEPAPGDPEKKVVDNKEVCEVREVVRINHHRNCLLCHPPSVTGQPNEVPGVIPIPSVPFSTSPKEAYGRAQSSGEPMVRADTTYLRQDFSVLMPVVNATPWPDMQRFDFLVRTRVVDGEELKALAEKVKARPADFVSENHKAAADALRRITGQNGAPNAAAWRDAFRVNRDND